MEHRAVQKDVASIFKRIFLDTKISTRLKAQFKISK